MSLKDCIKHDIQHVFMNTLDFCDELTIQLGRESFTITGSLQSNAIENNSGNASPLQSDAYTLYTNYPLENNYLLSTGTRITINKKSFSVVSVSDEMGIATIQLSTNVGR